MHVIQSEFYGDKTRWFIGTVVDNKPPFGLEGKVKVAIKGIHSTSLEDIPVEELPWADVLIPASVGGSSGHGEIPRLVPNTLVYGIFIDGELSQQPLVMGQLHTIESPSGSQIEAAPKDEDGAIAPYELPSQEKALVGDVASRLTTPAGSGVAGTPNICDAGYVFGEYGEPGLLSISVETDFESEKVLGDAIVFYSTRRKVRNTEPRDISLNKTEFSLNYIGSIERNASPSFSSSGSSTTASQQNTKITGQATKDAHLVEAVTVGSPEELEKATNFVDSK